MSQRAAQQLVHDLEKMALVRTWTETQEGGGRAMFMKTSFDLESVRDAQAARATALFDAEDD